MLLHWTNWLLNFILSNDAVDLTDLHWGIFWDLGKAEVPKYLLEGIYPTFSKV